MFCYPQYFAIWKTFEMIRALFYAFQIKWKPNPNPFTFDGFWIRYPRASPTQTQWIQKRKKRIEHRKFAEAFDANDGYMSVCVCLGTKNDCSQSQRKRAYIIVRLPSNEINEMYRLFASQFDCSNRVMSSLFSVSSCFDRHLNFSFFYIFRFGGQTMRSNIFWLHHFVCSLYIDVRCSIHVRLELVDWTNIRYDSNSYFLWR